MIQELGLSSCADTIIGGALTKGISDGERKRTSIGVELVVKPSFVFLDEPTTGLDSFTAEQLCRLLKRMSSAGTTVLFTIHQPSSEMFYTFDHLILLEKGRVMFQGEVASVIDLFARKGYACPLNYNPADWLMVRLLFYSIRCFECCTLTNRLSQSNHNASSNCSTQRSFIPLKSWRHTGSLQAISAT
jgi:ABC-type multidrug transport system ATPase subunit